MEIQQREKRKHERIAATRLQHGVLYQESTKRRFKIQTVLDASPFGIGLVVDGFVKKGAKVRLIIADNTSNIHMYGQVAWSSPYMEIDSFSAGNDLFSPLQLGISLR
jgi:hypothetical protein